MANRWGNNVHSHRFNFLGFQNHCGWWLQPQNKRRLLLGRKVMTLHIKKHWHHFADKGLYSPSFVFFFFFPVVMYGCKSWTLKKTEHQRINAFKLWYWRLLRVPWTARRSNQSILKEISPENSLEELMLMLKLKYFGHMMQRADSFEKTLGLGQTDGRRRGQ